MLYIYGNCFRMEAADLPNWIIVITLVITIYSYGSFLEFHDITAAYISNSSGYWYYTIRVEGEFCGILII